MAKKIEDIEGIGPSNGQKLRAAGINSVGKLLELCCDKKGRTATAATTGISESKLLKWVNHADLFRVSGVAGQYAELLEGAGVDTVKELRNRNAENLAAKMKEVNDARKLVRRPPSTKVVEDWVAQAKKLPPTISH
jgi:predicted flap endonuclease-1-like 5' DNA nuclease